MKVLITAPKGGRGSTFWTKENIELVKSLGQVVWHEGDEPMTKEQALELIDDCDVYVTLWQSPRLDKDLLEKGKNIKLLTHIAGTVVPFVSDEMWDRGIRVLSGNSYFARSVAEGTVGYMLAGLRRIPFYNKRLTENKQWKSPDDWNEGIHGKTIGLISYGEIARFLVPLLHPFGVKLKVYDIVPLPEEDVKKYGLEQASMEEIFSTCDIVSVHTPLYEATRHLIDARLLSMIKDGALFINTSRGAVIDQKALEAELAKNRFRAVLDVYEVEPLPADNPLYDMENVLLMPHMGGPTVDLHALITRELLIESKNYIDNGGELTHELTRERAEHMSLS